MLVRFTMGKLISQWTGLTSTQQHKKLSTISGSIFLYLVLWHLDFRLSMTRDNRFITILLARNWTRVSSISYCATEILRHKNSSILKRISLYHSYTSHTDINWRGILNSEIIYYDINRTYNGMLGKLSFQAESYLQF